MEKFVNHDIKILVIRRGYRPITPHSNSVFVRNRIPNLFVRRPEMTLPLSTKNKGEWNTQRLLGEPSAVLLFFFFLEGESPCQKGNLKMIFHDILSHYFCKVQSYLEIEGNFQKVDA